MKRGKVESFRNLEVWQRAFDIMRKALEAHMRALKIDPSSAHTCANIAGLFFSARRPDIALTFATRAVDLDPRFSGGQLNRASAINALNRCEEAAHAAQAACLRCGDDPILMYELGLAYLRKARTCADKALKLAPQFTSAKKLRATTFTRDKDPS